jgi:hypothetical protein
MTCQSVAEAPAVATTFPSVAQTPAVVITWLVTSTWIAKMAATSNIP